MLERVLYIRILTPPPTIYISFSAPRPEGGEAKDLAEWGEVAMMVYGFVGAEEIGICRDTCFSLPSQRTGMFASLYIHLYY